MSRAWLAVAGTLLAASACASLFDDRAFEVHFFRIRTQIGFHYDVIHGKWYGPNIGETSDPGPGATPPPSPAPGRPRRR